MKINLFEVSKTEEEVSELMLFSHNRARKMIYVTELYRLTKKTVNKPEIHRISRQSEGND